MAAGNGGRLILSGNNTYTGVTYVKSGSVLNIQHANALGSTADGTIMDSYAAVEIQGGITTAAEPLTLNGSGINWNGALRSVSGNNNYTGPITLGSDTRVWIDSGTLTLSGGVTGSGSTLEVVPIGNMVINSVISTGAGGLTMGGSGMLTLTANNTYTGATTVSAGTLEVLNATGSATGSGTVTINSGATLSGSGIIGGPVVITGVLAPGSSPGILTVNNQVTFQPGSTFNAEVFGSTTGTGYDQLTTSGPVSLAGSLAMTFGSFTPAGHDILFLINNTGAGATTGTFQYADNAKIGRFDGFDWYITYDANNTGSPSLNGGNDVAIYSVVPEPATPVLLATGLLGLLCFVWRKRR